MPADIVVAVAGRTDLVVGGEGKAESVEKTQTTWSRNYLGLILRRQDFKGRSKQCESESNGHGREREGGRVSEHVGARARFGRR